MEATRTRPITWAKTGFKSTEPISWNALDGPQTLLIPARAAVGLVGMHDVFRFVACRRQPLPRLGHDGEHEERGMLRARSPHLQRLVQVVLVFRQHGGFWVSEQISGFNLTLVRSSCWLSPRGEFPPFHLELARALRRLMGAFLLDGSRHLSSLSGGTMLAWRGISTSTPSLLSPPVGLGQR